MYTRTRTYTCYESGECDTCANEIAAFSIPKVVEHLVAVRLGHVRVNEETGVAELSDLLGQQLNSLHRVAENDALVDLQLEEGGREGGEWRVGARVTYMYTKYM